MNLVLGLGFLFIASIFGAFSTLSFKLGSAHKINLKNKHLILAVILAVFSFYFYVSSLKHAPLIYIYLMSSVSYIWAVILAKNVLKEKITRNKIFGVIYIILGMVLMNLPFN